MNPPTPSKSSPEKQNSPSDYAAVAHGYAEDVVAGKIRACKWVKLACRRHLDDLLRAAACDASFPYKFDEGRAARVCRFIEALPHVKDDFEHRAAKGEKLILQPWQVFLLAVLFGWIHRETGARRFRVAYICVPRKNGKSILSAGIALYMFAADGEYGAEVYLGATTEDQAWEVFRPAKQMVMKTPSLQQHFGISVTSPKKNGGHGAMQILSKGSRLETVVGSPGDGASPSCAIHDEYHEHKSSDQVDTMRTGMTARKQPLQVIITTAGYLIEGPCHAFQRVVEKVLTGSLDHEHIFGVIYTIDEDEDWSSEEALAKANPNWGVSVNAEDIRQKVKEALSSPAEQAKVKTKHANVWVNAKSGWMNMEAWRRCGDLSLSPERFSGEACYIGFDLSQTTDITSRAKLFIRDVDGEDHYYLFGDHYLPRDTCDLPEKKHYRDWEAQGKLHVTPGNVIDYRYIERDIVEDAGNFEVREIGFDKYNATDLVTRLMDDHGLPMVEVPQTTGSLSEPMKFFLSLVLSGRLHHSGDPVLTYGVSNVVAYEDWAGNIRPGKERGETKFAPKIDPFSAALNALTRAMKRGQKVETSISFL